MSMIGQRAAEYRRGLSEFDIFDIAMWWAPARVDGFVRFERWEEQVEACTRYGIGGGLVTAQTAMDVDPYIGNAELPPLLKGHDSFYGCAVVTPDMFFDRDKGRQYLRDLRDQRVVAARMYPGRYRHSTGEYAIGRMCEVLEELGFPLLIWHIDTDWDAVDRICERHPGLNVVLESMDRKLLYHARDYMSLLAKHKNFYIETHNLVLFNEYEVLDAAVGSSNLLYGSYTPYMTPDFSLYPVYAADLPRERKRRIFAGNAKDLLKLGNR
ncbi:MAG: amidohydrolase family protein [Christensenellaceae bacterium]|nr:amidohydrolase family protein [Christensenellaceae bacterium]MEA5066216.1 amidohydrolase family protein [Eubacteriales bacterium]MEA5069833.1 amidohydrolase family protein [Christensenellaceae bacterium]